MTEDQLITVTHYTRNGYFRVLFIKRGFVFLSSPIVDPEVLLRVAPNGKVEDMTI